MYKNINLYAVLDIRAKIIAYIDPPYIFYCLPSFFICCADNRLELPRFPSSTISSEDVEEVLEFVVAEEFDLRNL